MIAARKGTEPGLQAHSGIRPVGVTARPPRRSNLVISESCANPDARRERWLLDEEVRDAPERNKSRRARPDLRHQDRRPSGQVVSKTLHTAQGVLRACIIF